MLQDSRSNFFFKKRLKNTCRISNIHINSPVVYNLYGNIIYSLYLISMNAKHEISINLLRKYNKKKTNNLQIPSMKVEQSLYTK